MTFSTTSSYLLRKYNSAVRKYVFFPGKIIICFEDILYIQNMICSKKLNYLLRKCDLFIENIICSEKHPLVVFWGVSLGTRCGSLEQRASGGLGSSIDMDPHRACQHVKFEPEVLVRWRMFVFWWCCMQEGTLTWSLRRNSGGTPDLFQHSWP